MIFRDYSGHTDGLIANLGVSGFLRRGGEVAVVAATSEAEDECVPRDAVVGREVGSGGLRRHCHIGLVQRSGGDAVI